MLSYKAQIDPICHRLNIKQKNIILKNKIKIKTHFLSVARVIFNSLN